MFARAPTLGKKEHPSALNTRSPGSKAIGRESPAVVCLVRYERVPMRDVLRNVYLVPLECQPRPDNLKGHDLSEAHRLLLESLAIVNRIEESESGLGNGDHLLGEGELDRAETICRRAGEMVHAAFGTVDDMLAFIRMYVPVADHRLVEMYWDGIGRHRS